MQIINRNIWTITITSALMFGALFNGFFLFMYLAIATAAAMGLTVIGFIFDLFAKSSKGIRTTGFIFIFFLISTFTSYAIMKISEALAMQLAEKVIVLTYQYKVKNGHFPRTIKLLMLDSDITSKFMKQQSYWTDSNLRRFEIRSWSDGWNNKIFRSSDSTWVLQD